MRLRITINTEYPDPEQPAVMFRSNFLENFPLTTHSVIAGYWPDKGELDVRPTLISLYQRGYKVALPVMINKTQPLRFREWQPNMLMAAGRFGIPVPPDNMPELRPNVVLTPLLAFDRQGYRLGRGSGFYDRTLSVLRATGPVSVIGVGYSGQEVAAIPHHAFDQRLDWLMTETFVLRIRTDTRPLSSFGQLGRGLSQRP